MMLNGVFPVLALRACVKVIGVATPPVSATVVDLQVSRMLKEKRVGSSMGSAFPRKPRDVAVPVSVARTAY